MISYLKNLIPKSSITVVGQDIAESSDGWRLQFVGNSPTTWRLLYSEGGKNLEIVLESGIGGSRGIFWYTYLSKARWQTPYEHETLDTTDQKLIAKNIRSAMGHLKHNCKIV